MGPSRKVTPSIRTLRAVVEGNESRASDGGLLTRSRVNEAELRRDGGNPRVSLELELLLFGDGFPPGLAVADKLALAAQGDILALVVADQPGRALPSEAKTDGA